MNQRLYSPGACSPRRNWLVPGILAIAGATLAIYALSGSVANAIELQREYDLESARARSIAVGGATISALPPRSQRSRMVPGENPGQRNHGASFPVAGENLTPSDVHETKASAEWVKTKASFYGSYYDTGRGNNNKTSDGTKYDTNGLFCAAWVVPIGTVLEVRCGSRTMTLVVRDRQANRKTKLLDVPTGTWQKLTGQPLSRGLAQVEWRVKK